MLTVERNFLVDSGLEDTFAFLTDFTTTEQWDPGTVATTRVDNGPLGVGAEFHNVSRFLGRTTELDYTLTRLEPLARLVFTGNNKSVTSTDDMSFARSGTGTTITYVASFDFHGIAKLVAPLLMPGLSRLATRTVKQMQATLGALPS